MIAAADLTLYEFYAVIDEPADRSVRQSGRSCIFLCPCNHSLRSIYMGNTCSCCRGCEGSAACVSKKIQHFDRSSGISDLLREPVPVCCLFRKKTGMFETKRLQVECKFFIMNLPLFRETEEFPFSTAFLTAVIVTIHMFPAAFCLRSIPDYLRIRTDQSVLSPAF